MIDSIAKQPKMMQFVSQQAEVGAGENGKTRFSSLNHRGWYGELNSAVQNPKVNSATKRLEVTGFCWALREVIAWLTLFRSLDFNHGCNIQSGVAQSVVRVS
jgi:hypothetical protein